MRISGALECEPKHSQTPWGEGDRLLAQDREEGKKGGRGSENGKGKKHTKGREEDAK